MNAAKVYSLSENCHPTEGEGRGEQSTLAFKGKCTEMACREKSCFWQGKRVLFYTTIETF